MVKNQIDFNSHFSKDNQNINLRYKKFVGELVIEDYSWLKDLQLLKINKIDKLTLSNLPQLSKVTIQGCGLEELKIEKCSQIKSLNITSNSLTNLNFLLSLENLTELNLCGNNELIELLKPYSGSWKAWKQVQKISKSFEQNPQQLAKQLWDLQIENQRLISLKDQQPITLNSSVEFETKYQKLKRILHSLISDEKIKTEEINSLSTSNLTDKLTEQKNNLSELKETNQELREKIWVYEADKNRILQKEKELEELKNNIATNRPGIRDDLEELLEAQQENVQKWLTRIKNRLIKQITEEEINRLCQIQKKIAQLKNNINQQEQQINQIINNYYGNISQSIVGVEGSISIEGNFTPRYIAQQLQTTK